MSYQMIAVVGPTASGKTALAARLCYEMNGEVISGDSRQVYRGMDLGTGKDLEDYHINGRTIPCHLVDIRPCGDKYTVFHFQRDFLKAYQTVRDHQALPVLCGGSGLYVESVLRGYRLLDVPQNPSLRAALQGKSLQELTEMLSRYKTLHNTTDVDTAKRAIRAIEIEEFYLQTPPEVTSMPKISTLVVGVDIDRDLRRERITRRLSQRLKDGMVEEVKGLLDSGIAPEDLIYYGLEYKFLTLYLMGKLTYDEMFQGLETAIHQFAKRQMTWFRGMERRGIPIHWIPFGLPMEEKVEMVRELFSSSVAP